MAGTSIDYIVIGSEIKGSEEKGMADICIRISEKRVSDNVLPHIKAIQAKFAKDTFKTA